jgi:parallel beta-helix repeat protein
VDDDGPADFSTIQEAINAASESDLIYVYNGTYHEQLSITRTITLTGENKLNTIVDGDKTGNVIEISASNVAISGFTIQNSSRQLGTAYAGIKSIGNGNNVSDNIITKNKIGVFIAFRSYARIASNILKNNDHGISLSNSSEVTVVSNNFSGNTFGITLSGISSGNMIINNSITKSSSGGHGIYLSNSFNNTIRNNNITENYHGMWLSNSFNNIIVKNTIADNILLGIEIANSTNNTFYNNKFLNNPRQVKIGNQTNNNKWDKDPPTGGNYWDDYTSRYPDAQELDGSGIWDTPYVINSNNKDNYPLIPEFPPSTILQVFMIMTLALIILYRRKHH